MGDSKAILIEKGTKKDLSVDHNPYEKDEFERIIKNHGKVERVKGIFYNLDYYEEKIGPLRVWLQNENLPGLSVTRSFGDMIGKKVGIIAEPGNLFRLFVLFAK